MTKVANEVPRDQQTDRWALQATVVVPQSICERCAIHTRLSWIPFTLPTGCKAVAGELGSLNKLMYCSLRYCRVAIQCNAIMIKYFSFGAGHGNPSYWHFDGDIPGGYKRAGTRLRHLLVFTSGSCSTTVGKSLKSCVSPFSDKIGSPFARPRMT